MGQGHLLLIALGPVQDFIAQARRSRDLWFGSHLLSELSRAAARELANMDARLVFPAFDKDDPELHRCNEAIRADGTPPIAVANKILAQLPDGFDPFECARKVRDAVRGEWRAIAGGIRGDRRVRQVLGRAIDAVWNEQIEDILEIYSASVALGGSYAGARQAAERALAARKNLREFRPWQHSRDGAPQSSLDGARVSVLGEDRTRPEFRKLGIAPGEQLDTIGLIKRAGFRPDQFLPILNVAAAKWLDQAQDAAAAELERVRQACGAQGIPEVQRRLPAARALPYDAGVLYPSRWPALFGELDPADDADAARRWEGNVSPLLKKMCGNRAGEPPFYVACLIADGDRMGQAIDRISGDSDVATAIEKCRQFSRKLAGFPIDARRIVEEVYLGSLIYAGGDDVLAFLPVATAAGCAAELAECFASKLAGGAGQPGPTLSVGIGIGHALDSMGELLALAKEAEQLAKRKGRDRLAIILDKRSGGRLSVALPWKDAPLKRLRQDARLLEGGLSRGKVYELAALGRRFPESAPSELQDATVPALRAYAADVLAHRGEDEAVTLEELGVPKLCAYDRLHEAIATATDRVLIARALQEAGFS